MHSQTHNLEFQVANKHRQSHFAPAFLFLSAERRQALKTLYAVCRTLDDAVDVGIPDKEGFLAAWKQVFESQESNAVDPFGQRGLATDFLEAADKFGIPLSAMVELIDKGVAVDLKQNRFQTAMDTEAYCYGVAGTVGLACLPIFGVPAGEAKLFAIRLGIAVQWTNIIRDVGVDAAAGRIYLPLDHLELFGYTEQDLLSRKNSSTFQALMHHEYAVAQDHYLRALELMPRFWAKPLLPARIMGGIYARLLEKIKSRDFPVFESKVRLNFMEKIGAVLSVLNKKNQ